MTVIPVTDLRPGHVWHPDVPEAGPPVDVVGVHRLSPMTVEVTYAVRGLPGNAGRALTAWLPADAQVRIQDTAAEAGTVQVHEDDLRVLLGIVSGFRTDDLLQFECTAIRRLRQAIQG